MKGPLALCDCREDFLYACCHDRFVRNGRRDGPSAPHACPARELRVFNAEVVRLPRLQRDACRPGHIPGVVPAIEHQCVADEQSRPVVGHQGESVLPRSRREDRAGPSDRKGIRPDALNGRAGVPVGRDVRVSPDNRRCAVKIGIVEVLGFQALGAISPAVRTEIPGLDRLVVPALRLVRVADCGDAGREDCCHCDFRPRPDDDGRRFHGSSLLIGDHGHLVRESYPKGHGSGDPYHHGALRRVFPGRKRQAKTDRVRTCKILAFQRDLPEKGVRPLQRRERFPDFDAAGPPAGLHCGNAIPPAPAHIRRMSEGSERDAAKHDFERAFRALLCAGVVEGPILPQCLARPVCVKEHIEECGSRAGPVGLQHELRIAAPQEEILAPRGERPREIVRLDLGGRIGEREECAEASMSSDAE